MGIGDGTFYAPYIPMLKELWQRKFVWVPCRCELSNKLLWLTFAYQRINFFREDIQIFRKASGWHSEQAHTFYLLQGN